MGSSFGRLFRVTTFGESHGGGLGVVIEGCPPGLRLDLDALQADLDRRRPGQSALVSARKEADRVEVLSGVFEGRTLGTSLAMLVRNKDADPRAYAPFKDVYRPSHADYTYEARYGLRAWAGGGRASARETVGRVAAGAVARQVLREHLGVEIVAWVDQVGSIVAAVDDTAVDRAGVDAHVTRCPDLAAATEMEALIRAVRKDGDTIGGVVRCVVRGVPAGLGAPVFDKLEADLAKAMMSLPAAKGFTSGSGFDGVVMRGSAHNDVFEPGATPGSVQTRTNHSGGIQGGISNGMPITMGVAFKPVATIFTEQETVDTEGRPATVKPRGRHDPCVVPRAVPMVEAMAALVLVDHLMRWRGQRLTLDGARDTAE
jgi:chorismate synthase